VSMFDDMQGTDWREMERRAHEMRRSARRMRREERGRNRGRYRGESSPPPIPPSGGRSLYRSRCGVIFGVCRGIAEHMGVPVFWSGLGPSWGVCSPVSGP